MLEKAKIATSYGSGQCWTINEKSCLLIPAKAHSSSEAKFSNGISGDVRSMSLEQQSWHCGWIVPGEKAPFRSVLPILYPRCVDLCTPLLPHTYISGHYMFKQVQTMPYLHASQW